MTVAHSSIVPLESGDHLTQEEFHRRYCARPDIAKAELVRGIVYVASPVSPAHGRPDHAMSGWLFAYEAYTPGVQAFGNTTVVLPGDTEVQPDVLLMRVEPPGSARLIADKRIEGPPELVIEIAASSASYDLHSKKDAYARASVPEYIVWQVYERRIDWFRLRDSRYLQMEPDARGVIESQLFPGLRLAVAKMLAGDFAAVLAELAPVGR